MRRYAPEVTRLFVAALMALALPATAAAQLTNCVAPPGTAAIEQYCEQVAPPAHGGKGRDAAPVDARDVAALQKTASGQALLRSVGRTRSIPAKKRGTRTVVSDPGAPVPPSSSAARGALFSLSDAVTLGAGVVLVALAILAALAGLAATRRRRPDA